jgi:4-aminobutyrate aminotransferase-like enzyme
MLNTAKARRRWAIETIARLGGGGERRLARSAAVTIDHGRGSYLHSESGLRYLDVVSGFGVASLGHCHPRWVEAVVAQAERLAVSPFHTAELARYLDALSAVMPDRLGRTALFSGGAEAVEVAIRLAQTSTGRPDIVTFQDSFHGKTAGVRYAGNPNSTEAVALGTGRLRSVPFPQCEAHDAVTYSDCEESPAQVMARIRAHDLAEVAAVLVEPVLGTAGNLPPRRPFLQHLRRLCDDLGLLLIFDESITGFGRTGKLFAFEYYGVEPDVLILGKGMGGGFPMSAVCASGDLWDSSALRLPSACSSSYGGNPLACAAGLATLEILRSESFLEHVRTASGLAAHRLRELAATSPRVARPRGVGWMLGFDLVNPATAEPAVPASCSQAFKECRDRGVLLATDVPRVRLSPPLTVSAQETEDLFDVLHEVLT